MRTMHTGSSSSRPPRKPQQSVQPPPKETEKIHDRNWCSNTFSKRHTCIINGATKLSELPNVLAAVIMFSPGGQLKLFGSPSIEEVFLMYLCHEYGEKLPMSAEAPRECESCQTKEDYASLIMKYLDAVVRLRKKLVDFDNNPSFLQPVRSLSRRKMQTGSSSSQKQNSNKFSKSSKTILNKASKLSKDTGTPVAVIMFSPAGNPKSFGTPSIEQVFWVYLLRNYDLKPPMSPKEGWLWPEKECESSLTKQNCAFLIMQYLRAVVPLLKKLKDFENNPSVNVGAGHESGVGAGRDPEGWTVNEILSMDAGHESGVGADHDPEGSTVDVDLDSLFKEFEAMAPSAHYDMFVTHYFAPGGSDSAAGGKSSGVESNSTDFNPDDYIRSPSPVSCVISGED